MRRLGGTTVLNEDRGATLVFVAILLVVLFGFTAFAVDIAASYHERRVVQNGADAAVLAIAEDCARGTLPCGEPYVSQTAQLYADANAPDLATTVEELILDLENQEVTVRTLSHDPNTGRDALVHFFAAVLGIPESPIRAEATARWGTLGASSTVPITMSMCDITEGLDEDGNYILREGVITVTFLDPSGDTCDAHPGFDADEDELLPAGFGWLRPTDEDPCTAYTVPHDPDGSGIFEWAFQDPGADPNRGCLGLDTYLIPIFVDVMFQTNPDCEAINPHPTDCYGIGGYTSFTVIGYRFPGYTGGTPGCSPPKSCITGEVGEETVFGPIDPSFQFGVVVVELIK